MPTSKLARRSAHALTVLLFASVCGAQWQEQDVEPLLTVTSNQAGSLFGWLVAPMGDVTGDGVGDFAATWPFYDVSFALSSVGRVSVHSGATGNMLWSHNATTTSAVLGFALEVMSDIDGDGMADLAGGAPFNTGLPGGRVFVYSGADGNVLHTFEGDSVFDSLGASIAVDGDLDGDGVLDIAVAATGHDAAGPDAGRVTVYSSSDFAVVVTIDPTTMPVADFGTALAFVGDVTGDGRDDLAIGERLVDNENAGRIHVYAFDGGVPQIVYTIDDVDMGCPLCGDRLDGGRDLDGDGVGDLMLGEMSLDRVRLFSGVDGTVIRTLTAEGEDGQFGSGRLVDDVDCDGVADVLVGARASDAGGDGAGRVYLYSGATGQLIRTITNTVAGQSFGAFGATLGDLDDDGVIDLVVGGSGGPMAASTPGRVFVIAGTGIDAAIDVDGSGVIDVDDLLLVLLHWGCAAPDGCPGDATGDGMVNVDDLLAVITAWGAAPCP